MKYVIFLITTFILLSGCASRDVVVINDLIYDNDESITFNGKPITIEELSILADTTKTDDIDFIVITESGAEECNIKRWKDVLEALIDCHMSDSTDGK